MTCYRLPAALAALLLLAAPFAQGQTTADEPVRRPLPERNVLTEPYQRAVEQGTRAADGRPGPNHWVNRPTYDIDMRLLPEERRVEGTARIDYQNNSPDSLGILVLALLQNHHKEKVHRLFDAHTLTGGMDIERVAVNGRELERNESARPAYRIDSTQLVVRPPSAVPPGQQVELEIDYRYRIPKVGVLHGWMAERFLGNAEFYSDHGDYTYSVTVPAGWLLHGTGVLQNPEAVLGEDVRRRRQEAYQSDEPVRVLQPGQRATPAGADSLTYEFRAEDVRDIVFSAMKTGDAGDWNWEAARADLSQDGPTDYTRVNAFWRDGASLWDEEVSYMQDGLRFLSDFTGLEYPWPQMSAVEVGSLLGGGVEFPMMTALSDYRDAEPQALYGVTAHELTHMWVPMTISTNERRFGWMDEGIATFSEGEAFKNRYPESDRQPHVRNQRGYVRARTRTGIEAPIMRWSDYHDREVDYSVASYPKAAAMLFALRGLLGEDAFTDAWQGFMNAWAYKHPLPGDFFNLFEDAHGEELDWFWDAFYHQTWTLDQGLTSVENTAEGVRLRIEDRGRAMMPVDLTMTLENGETVERRLPVDLWLRGAREITRTIETEAPAERVVIDADRYYPDTDRSNNVWER
ncbi:MAG: peptidase [Bacteroidetes bacterium QH_8_67_23]|nr:MAG: peptidase [Bacteroidetes bacterium QH_8_67_23]